MQQNSSGSIIQVSCHQFQGGMSVARALSFGNNDSAISNIQTSAQQCNNNQIKQRALIHYSNFPN